MVKMENSHMATKGSDETKKAKKNYESPIIEEHDALDKTSACGLYSASYVSGYGYYH
jgi:hypothetical protein